MILDSILNVLRIFPFKRIFTCMVMLLFSTTIFSYFEAYNIVFDHQLILLISFYVFVTCFNKLIGYLIEDIKSGEGDGKHAK